MITKHGRPAAVMLSIDDLESLEETLQILSDPALMRSVRRARARGGRWQGDADDEGGGGRADQASVSDREPFDVAWTPTARRNLRRLPEKVAAAVVEFVYGTLAERPDRARSPAPVRARGQAQRQPR